MGQDAKRSAFEVKKVILNILYDHLDFLLSSKPEDKEDKIKIIRNKINSIHENKSEILDNLTDFFKELDKE